VKPQSEAFLAKARELLDQADAVLVIGYADAAGRGAYLAGFPAAQALLFERLSRVFKTHKGVHSEFSRFVKDDSRFDLDDRAFLGHTYSLKTIAGYEVGPGSQVSHGDAVLAIAAARGFIEKIEQTIRS
jgi:uncharacterized protein (UPF0332 family)